MLCVLSATKRRLIVSTPQGAAMFMSGIKANSEDNLCCAACVTITWRPRVEEVM